VPLLDRAHGGSILSPRIAPDGIPAGAPEELLACLYAAEAPADVGGTAGQNNLRERANSALIKIKSGDWRLKTCVLMRLLNVIRA
jgi:hypothetical protein